MGQPDIEFAEWSNCVVTEFIFLADRPLLKTPANTGALTALFYANLCPHAAARALCAAMGIDTSDYPDPCENPPGISFDGGDGEEYEDDDEEFPQG